MYEVYALKYAERSDIAGCNFFIHEKSHDLITLHYYVWLILGGPHPVLVDTGYLESDAKQRGIRTWVSPAAMVERAGFKAAQIPLAIVTHLHYDHWAGHSLFPGAEFVVQREEAAFWTGPHARFAAFRDAANVGTITDFVALGFAGRVRIVDGDQEIMPGLRVHRVGGHTAGLQIVSVETARGRVVIASDAAHFYRNLERRQPVTFITNLPDMYTAFETIETLAGSEGLVVTGHDPQVAERFKPVEPGIIRIA